MRGEASGSLGSVRARTNPIDRGDFTLKRVCSIFSQILQLIPRDRFEAAVEKHQSERHARGFSSWGQFVAMLFCQLAQAKSLRRDLNALARCGIHSVAMESTSVYWIPVYQILESRGFERR
jgi:hypothetical protein